MTIPSRDSERAATVSQLLALHDDEFVRCVYQTLLGRSADESGLCNYLAQVREGVAKEEIVIKVALSEEGRRAAVVLPGLSELERTWQRARPNLLARSLRRVFGTASEPIQVSIRRIENQLYLLGEKSAHRIDRLEIALGGLAPMSGGRWPLGTDGMGTHGEFRDKPTGAAIAGLSTRGRGMHARLRAALAEEARERD